MAAKYEVTCDNLCGKSTIIRSNDCGYVLTCSQNTPPPGWTVLQTPNEYGVHQEYVFCSPHCMTLWIDARAHDPRFTSK